jgi:hypothetical protein
VTPHPTPTQQAVDAALVAIGSRWYTLEDVTDLVLLLMDAHDLGVITYHDERRSEVIRDEDAEYRRIRENGEAWS